MIILTSCLKHYNAFLLVLKERSKSLTHITKSFVCCSYATFHLQLYFVWLSPFFQFFESFTLPKPINPGPLYMPAISTTYNASPPRHDQLNFYPFLQNQKNHHFWLLDKQHINIWNKWEIYSTVPQHTLTLRNYSLWNFLWITSPGLKFR